MTSSQPYCLSKKTLTFKILWICKVPTQVYKTHNKTPDFTDYWVKWHEMFPSSQKVLGFEEWDFKFLDTGLVGRRTKMPWGEGSGKIRSGQQKPCTDRDRTGVQKERRGRIVLRGGGRVKNGRKGPRRIHDEGRSSGGPPTLERDESCTPSRPVGVSKREIVYFSGYRVHNSKFISVHE